MTSVSDSRQTESAKGSFYRRDFLAAIESEIQKLWEDRKIYEATAPFQAGEVGEIKKEKFFCTFPYPYMNGRLHLGHAFTITKSEFQARFQRLLGKNVLWPFAFHCTGMPIPACADKLKREIEEKNSRKEGSLSIESPASPILPNGNEEELDSVLQLGKFSGKKSKAAKSGGAKAQWDIMASLGIPEDEIPKFIDSQYWLDYFPPLGKADLQKFGAAIDWRRSFITTERNPYYDGFVRWQFNTLKKREKIKFGMRPAIFSRIDGQPCADHDRALGEGSNPQEYTLIKIKVKDIPQRWIELNCELANREIYLVAATLRPETMYGQTNCFILPDGDYGFFIGFDRPLQSVDAASNASGVLQKVMTKSEALKESKTIYICSNRSADNMAHQGIVPVESQRPFNKPFCLLQVKGSDLMGLSLSGPNAIYETIYSLPMMGISMEKGTGVVTSVPSDAPDDYATLRDLQLKDALREKFGITKAMVDIDVVEIIEIPELGRRAAVDLCTVKKVKSQNDKIALAEIKDEVYKKGFYEGIMLIGSQKGQKVCDAKQIVRDELIESGDAISYYEPERRVISRAGDSCVVALCNQWYEDYANEEWKTAIDEYITNPEYFNAYSNQCLHQLKHVVGWLKEWACSRHYGLGTILPWEKENRILIESLSDSTIYMSYYTIAHYLQGDVNGTQPGLLNLSPDLLTDEVFDFIFMQSDDYPETSISREELNRMRSEFNYWYPLDLRVSGKDLIFNHLTMALFNHAAIWPNNRDTKWPRSYFCNGHVMVDAEKMSKSAGNFLSLDDSIRYYTADATRIGLADAGDSLDDANFQRENANSAIMRLYLLDQFVDEMIKSTSLRTGDKEWMDLAFENEIVFLAEQTKLAYEKMVFRDALKFAFFDFGTVRDLYRNLTGPKKMHQKSIGLWIDTQAIILSPLAPHICENLWTNKLKKPNLVVESQWPDFDGLLYDPVLHREFECLFNSIDDFRKMKEKSSTASKKAKKGHAEVALSSLDSAVIYVAKEYLSWQQTALKILQTIPLNATQTAPVDPNYMSRVKSDPSFLNIDKKLAKDVMSFASYRMKDELPLRGISALELQLPFDELMLLQNNLEYIKRSLSVENIDIRFNTDNKHAKDDTDRKALAVPSKPSVVFWSSQTPA